MQYLNDMATTVTASTNAMQRQMLRLGASATARAVKTDLEGDKRRFVVEPTFAALRAAVIKTYSRWAGDDHPPPPPCDPSGASHPRPRRTPRSYAGPKLRLRYADDEGDLITLGCDADLAMACDLAQGGLLRLTVCREPGGAAPPAPFGGHGSGTPR